MGKKNGFTVAQLIEFLQGLKSPNAVVKMSSDPEGNEIRFWDSFSQEDKKTITLFPGARAE